MKKEHIKTFILILLIVNSLQLTVQIWFDSNLWPQGYGFFESVKNSTVIHRIFGGGAAFSEEEVFQNAIKPERIIVNGGGAREVYIINTEDYDAAYSYIADALNSFVINGADVQKISDEQWENLFKGKSMYIDFGYNLDGNSLNFMYGAKPSQGRFDQLSSVSGFVLTPDSVTNSCTVSVRDNSDNSITEYRFKCNSTRLLQFIEESTYGKQQNDMFAFEINLDEQSDGSGGVERMVELSPLALLSVSADLTNENNAVAEPIFKNQTELEHFAEKTLPSFGYTPSSLRKTVQSNGTVVFVENNATISYHPDGTVEYSAVSKKRGLKKSDSVNDCRQAVNDVLKIVRELCEEAEIRSDSLNLHLCSDLVDNRNNKYNVRLNNMFGGIAVNYAAGVNNAVYANVDDGYITDFTMHLANFYESEKTTRIVPVLAAIDSLYADYGKNTMIISDVYKCYDFDSAGEIGVKWAFKVEGSDEVLVIGNEDD